MSLYRKYRPQNFENLVGQEHVKITLSNALKLGKVNHAYLFTGPRGTGKTSSARILAKAVNCLNLVDAVPCEKCDICSDINEGRLIDVIEIDAASNRGIDEMRDLREKINFAPTRAKSKVYIIDEVHMLTKEAFNALLKTLEEPPAHVYFILATTEVHKVPETILSRCQRFDFRRIEDDVLISRLKFIATNEQIEAEEKALEAIAHQAQGGLRDAIGLMEQLSVSGKLSYENVVTILGISGFASLENLYNLLVEKNVKGALDELHKLYAEGHDLLQFNKSFLEYLRRKMLENVAKNQNPAWTLHAIEIFQAAYDKARFAVITQLPMEMAIIETCIEKQQVVSAPVVAEKKSENLVKSEPKITLQQAQVVESAAAKPEVAAKQIVEEMSTSREHKGLAFDEVKKNWARIYEHIKIPAVKRSFKESFLANVEGGTVTVSYATKFHVEKIMESANKIELESAMSEVLGMAIKLAAIVKPIAKEISAAADNAVENVADFFGGEVV